MVITFYFNLLRYSVVQICQGVSFQTKTYVSHDIVTSGTDITRHAVLQVGIVLTAQTLYKII